MMITPQQLRAARALMHLEQAELARRAHVSLITIRRIEAADGGPRVAPATLETVRRVLEEPGIEFIGGPSSSSSVGQGGSGEPTGIALSRSG